MIGADASAAGARRRTRCWWPAAAAVAVGTLDAVAAFSSGPLGAAARPLTARAAVASAALPSPQLARRGSTVREAGLLRLGMESDTGSKDWSPRNERDLAMGFLTANAPAAAKPATASKGSQAKAELLAQQAREALEAAYEAEELAKSVKAKLGGASKIGKETKPKLSNGLSGMLSPVAMQMASGQAEYLSRCPIRQMQEDLSEIRCGVMNIAGKLGPTNLLALGFVFYVISVIQISS